MSKKKSISLIVVIILIFSSVSFLLLNNFSFKETKKNPLKPEIEPRIYEKTLLDVPYVGQETSTFCAYASITAMLQYLDIDVNLDEILFYFGLGYSSHYFGGGSSFLFYNGVLLTQRPENINFVSSLFGVSFNYWYPEISQDESKNWKQYWIKIKENMTKEIPIMTSVDSYSLPSIKKQYNLPDSIWDSVSPQAHSIILVGYNEINNSVCYNDPGTDYFGNPSDGYKVWMTKEELKKAVSKTAATKYFIGICNKTGKPLSNLQRYNETNILNIEKLKGNTSAFFIESADLSFGIKATRDLKKHFSGNILEKIQIKRALKKTGRYYRKYVLNNWIYAMQKKVTFKEFKPMIITDSSFKLLALEKQYAANYLRTLKSENTEMTANLLEEEADYWLKIDEYYNQFLKKGYLIGFFKGFFIINSMEKTFDKIIQIEENILNL